MHKIVKAFVAFKILGMSGAMGPAQSAAFEAFILEKMLEKVSETIIAEPPYFPEDVSFWFIDYFLSLSEESGGEDEYVSFMTSIVPQLMPVFENTKYEKNIQDRIDSLEGIDISVFEEFLNG